MNDKDKEAFEKYVIENNVNKRQIWNELSLDEIWEAACEYKQTEIDELKDVLCFYANGYAHEIDDSCNAYYEDGHIRLSSGKRARQVLKELEELEGK